MDQDSCWVRQKCRAEAATRKFCLISGAAKLVLMKHNGGIDLVESETFREII